MNPTAELLGKLLDMRVDLAREGVKAGVVADDVFAVIEEIECDARAALAKAYYDISGLIRGVGVA